MEGLSEAFEYDWNRRGLKLIDNEIAQYESHMFPLAVVGRSGWALPNWVQGYERHWRQNEEVARAFEGEHPAFARDGEFQRTWPHRGGWDGFFVAAWRRV